MKKICIALCAILITIIAAMLTLYGLHRPPRSFDTEVLFEVYSGDSGFDVAQKLKDNGLIQSKLLFLAIQKYKKGMIKAGYYKIPAATDISGIYNMLVSGKQMYIKITIPEGLTISKIADVLAEQDITSRESFIASAHDVAILQKYGIPSDSAEGYLFPDTYYFCRHESADDVLESFLRQFFVRINEHFPECTDSTLLFQKITLASIIEKEYRDPAEIKKIAGVFANRLKIGMGLQSCATIIYITTEIMGRPHTGFVTLEDTKIDSPYNTYLWAGLPPGPISNPGIRSIEAAFSPERHGYLYFILVDEEHGRHFFSKTLDEHAHARHSAEKR